MPNKEPKITKFVVLKSGESVGIAISRNDKKDGTYCDCCLVQDTGNIFFVGEQSHLCLPCIKGLSEVVKELK